MQPRFQTFALASCLALQAGGFSAMAQTATGSSPVSSSQDWLSAGHDSANTRDNASETLINPQTVKNLKTKWAFHASGDISATPTVEGTDLYVPDFGGSLYRINTNTGKAIWTKKLADYTGIPTSFSRTSPAIAGNLLVLGDQASATVLAVDRTDGHLVWKVLLDSNEQGIITNSPLVIGQHVFVGTSSNEEGAAARSRSYKLSFRGSINELDLQTGNPGWRFNTVPDGYTGGSVWGSTFAFDSARNSLYVSTGNNYSVPSSVAACQKTAPPDPLGQAACLAGDDYIDSILALNPDNGSLKWVHKLGGADTWIVSCSSNSSDGNPCPDPAGPDYDFSSGPNFFQTTINSKQQDVVGAGQKSGMYWALNPDDGSTLWANLVGPGGTTGGIEWGSAVDGRQIYTAVNNAQHKPFQLKPSGERITGGAWGALDASTGVIQWQVPVTGVNPKTQLAAGGLGAVSVANGVVFAPSMSGDMVALDAVSGVTLWKFTAAGSVAAGPAIVNGSVYWGTGYARFSLGKGDGMLYAFSVQ